MKRQANKPENSLPYHIRGAFRGFETALSRYLATRNLPLSHYHILRLQWDDEGYTQNIIAEKSFMSESVASQVIKAMEKAGTLERKVDPADARKRRVFLTPQGEDIRNDIVVKGIEISRQHAPQISVEDYKTTMRVLKQVRDAFDDYNKSSADSPKYKQNIL